MSAGVNTIHVADILWNRHLSEEDRDRLLIEADTSSHTEEPAFVEVGGVLGGAAGMWKFLRGVSIQRAYLDVALHVNLITPTDYEWLLREFGELPLDTEVAQDEAIMRGELVLIRTPATLYWHAELIEIDWNKNRASWNFFLTTCENAKRSQPI